MLRKFLLIQTAFTGDAILATALLEKLHTVFPDAEIDLLVRKGNDVLFEKHPFIANVLVWDKKKNKYAGLFRLLKQIRAHKYDDVINIQRFATTGFLTAFSGARTKRGFDKNPFSFLFSKKIKHQIESGKHETDRNQKLIEDLTGTESAKPVLYPTPSDYTSVETYLSKPFITIAPGSVWFTKTFPEYQWIDLIRLILNRNPGMQVYLLGSPAEKEKCERIRLEINNENVVVLAGALSLLQSAALMSKAQMNYTNDSAPMHLCSAVNAPVTAVYCSTVPEFGFGPLSDQSFIVQTKILLPCKPCGLHGYRECPLIHFKCAHTILTEDLIHD